MFQKRHYEQIASILAKRRTVAPVEGQSGPQWVLAQTILDDVARDFADQFAADNPRFNREYFCAAAGARGAL